MSGTAIVPEWATCVGGSSNIEGYGTTVDNSGFVYICGLHNSKATFYNKNGLVGGYLDNSGGYDSLIAKYDSNGSFIWASRISGISRDIAYGIATDSRNNVYITGYWMDISCDFYNANGTLAKTIGDIYNTGSFINCYLAKYDASGWFQWASYIGNAGGSGTVSNDEMGRSVAVDGSDNVIITGYYGNGSNNRQSVIYNSDGSIFTPPRPFVNVFFGEGFLIKYNNAGFTQWATSIISGIADRSNGITTDSINNIYITGICSGNVSIYSASDLSGAAPSMVINVTGGQNTFIVKYNPNGSAQWGSHIDGTNSSYGSGIITDSLQNVYVTGSWYGITCYFYDNTGSLASTITDLSNINYDNCYLAKYNSSGIFQWATYIGNANGSGTGSNNEIGQSVTVDLSNNIYITGVYGISTLTRESVIYNSDASIYRPVNPLINARNDDAFIVCYNSSGFAESAVILTSGGSDLALSIFSDKQRNIYLCGYYGGTLSIYGSMNSNPVNTLINRGSSFSIFGK